MTELSQRAPQGIRKEEQAWLQARARVYDSDLARKLCRLLRKSGADRFWQQGGEVHSIWPDTPQTHASLRRLEAELPGVEFTLMEFRAAGPLPCRAEAQAEAVGPGLSLSPAWCGAEAGPEVLVIDALTAFGAGDHPSTLLNLALLCGAVQRQGAPLWPDAWLADVGSGTGVLALAMALLTGRRVLAVDPDPAAKRALARNQALNPLAGPLVSFALGTHACLGSRFPLMAANLPGPILQTAGEHLAHRLTRGGVLVISGFRQEMEPDMESFFNDLGLTAVDRRQLRGWSGLALAKG